MENPVDLIGMKFGRLTVIKYAGKSKDSRSTWLCRCDCGNERVVTGKCLKNGHTKSCGCLAKDLNSHRSFIDHTGERFGRLSVVERADDYVAPNGKHHIMWKCKCDCGNTLVVDVCQLTSGKTKSCGCLHSEATAAAHTIHGGSHDRLYKVYYNMKNRCLNTNSSDYKYYGGRGISICDEWLSDYGSFKSWAYSNGYDDTAEKGKCTIDRIDTDGNYEPNNCRWVDMSIQSRNRRNVINK